MDESKAQEYSINWPERLWQIGIECLAAILLLHFPTWLLEISSSESLGFLRAASHTVSQYLPDTRIDLAPIFWIGLALFALVRFRRPNDVWVECLGGLLLINLCVLECPVLLFIFW